MKRLAAIIALFASGGVLHAQDDPTDTPTTRALSALLPLRDQARHGDWLRYQADEAQFAEWLSWQREQSGFARWLAAQQQAAAKAVFASYLGQPELLLGVLRAHGRPNYAGNAFEPVRRNLWLDVAEGQPLPAPR